MRKISGRSVLYIVVCLLLIGILVFAGIQALRIYVPQSRESRDFEEIKEEAGIEDVSPADIINEKKSSSDNKDEENANSGRDYDNAEVGITKLEEMNSDFVGWLSIPDTEIDYPVMKSPESDPEFYLHRDFDKNYSFSGTLFIGEGCNADSDAFIIYGHNMNAGTMFGSLDSFGDPEFAREHRDIVFQTPVGNRVYRVFAAFQTKIYTEPTDEFEYYRCVGKLDKMDYKEVVDNIRDMSIISTNEEPEYPEQIMLLSTCYYHTEEGRFVVAAYRIA